MYTRFVRRLNYVYHILRDSRWSLSRTTLGKVPCPTAQADFSQMVLARFKPGPPDSESPILPTELVMLLKVMVCMLYGMYVVSHETSSAWQVDVF